MHDYFQRDNIEYLKNSYGKEQWIQVAGECSLHNAKASFWCCLFLVDHLKEVMSSPEWDSSNTDCFPGFICSGDSTHYYRYSSLCDYIEPLLFYREFYGVRKNYVEVSEEFRLLNNMYYDTNDNKFYAVLDSGNSDEAVRIKDNVNVFVNIKYLKRYAAAKQMGILLFFDIRYETSGGLAENTLSSLNEEYTDESLIYDLFGDEKKSFSRYAFSRLLGKKVILPQPVSECGYFPYEKKREYLEYIIGCDENGDDLTYTLNPDKLANYFGANPDAPHYLTPVFFKRGVLDKYLKRPDLYKITDGRLSCGYLWSMEIDNDHKAYVAAYLGDLGRDLPEDEQLHWKSYNVLCDEKPSKTAIMRDMCNIPAEPNVIDLKFKRDYKALQEKWNRKYRWCIFKELTSKDKYNLDNIRIPSSNSQEEFDTLVLSLVKCVIDSLNEEMLVIATPEDNDGKTIRGISKLQTWLSENGATDYEKHITFLRNLQELRSTGTGHRKGKKYDKVSKLFNIDQKSLIDVYEQILSQADEFIMFLTGFIG